MRRILGADGRELLQVRLPLGIEQYELQGRPDGLRPEGYESWLEYYRARLKEYCATHGSDRGFVIDTEAMRRLEEEGMLYYHRYLLCFQIGELDIVLRDTERNMELFTFVGKYAPSEEEGTNLTQYWPYILRIHATARAMQRLAAGDQAGVLEILEKARHRIRTLTPVPTQVFAHERKRSLDALQALIRQLRGKRPPSEKELLQRRMRAAIAREDYERAARIRDMIRRLDESGHDARPGDEDSRA